MNVWIDLDNSPHVHFFAPLIRQLEHEGVETTITVRSFAQTEELSRWYGLKFVTIGEHKTPRSFRGRVFATLRRAAQLAGYIRSRKPLAAFSHGSRALTVASWALGIPVMTLYDYEFVSAGVFYKLSRRVLVPSVIPVDQLREQGLDVSKLVPYPGLKEEVYIYDFVPDPEVFQRLGLDPNKLILTVRPPATWAHYHNSKSEILFRGLAERLRKERDAQVIVLSRTREQAEDLIRNYGMVGPPFRILSQAVDALSLMAQSDGVFSGGGTMTREAALLGVDSYSTFGGELGAVDKALAGEGKLKILQLPTEVEQLVFKKRRPTLRNNHQSRQTRDFICDQILQFVRENKV
jgi:uncharacterized protein